MDAFCDEQADAFAIISIARLNGEATHSEYASLLLGRCLRVRLYTQRRELNLEYMANVRLRMIGALQHTWLGRSLVAVGAPQLELELEQTTNPMCGSI